MTHKLFIPLFIVAIMMLLVMPASVQAGIDCGTVPQFWVQLDPAYLGPTGNGTYEAPFRTEAEAIARAREQRSGGCVFVLNGTVLVKDVYYVGPFLPPTGAPLSPEATYSLTASLAVLLLGGGWWLRRRSTQLVPSA